ncbi:autotransporter assembly complex protein TamA [Psychromonas sp. CNPT3]|uniref:autotransporter assembly complex protein TamA n=1 Tax=Psychromonas sp. CNPT3 TaxID=314282 RepID=UPI0005A2F101|nr:autotransporter assembly complex family protein [Psychromonas sp. CNPT3]
MKLLRFHFLLSVLLFSTFSYANVSFQIEGLDRDESANVTFYLETLPVTNNAKNSIYLQQVEKSTREALQALGYYQVTLSSKVTGETGKQTLLLTINKGKQTRIVTLDIRLTGEAKTDPAFQKILDDFPLKINSPLNHAHYTQAKALFKKLAIQRGYFDAFYKKSRVEVKRKTAEATLYFWFDSGIRYQFGELVFNGDVSAKQQIKRLKNFKSGDPFLSSTLNEYSQDLTATGYFARLMILPDIKQKKGRLIPLNVIVKMRPKNSFKLGGGYSTDEGIRGKFRWEHPWLNQYGHSLETSIIASRFQQEASLTYKIPLQDPLYNYLSLQGGYKAEKQNDTDTDRYLFGISRHWRAKDNWRSTLSLKFDHEYGRQGEQYFDSKLILPGFSYSHVQSEGGINVTSGRKLLASIEVSHKAWLSSANLIKLYAQGKFINRYKQHQFITSVELGAIFTDSLNDVPSSMRFFSGGDQSVRGFDYESISPTDSLGEYMGAKYLATLSLEYRLPIAENWKIAFFSDTGTATNDFSEPISQSVGVGIIWLSLVGPIRLYWAAPLTQSNNAWKIHFMIGPEL